MKTYPDHPILTLGFTTDEEIVIDLDAAPPLCASHRAEIPEGMERLTLTVRIEPVGERTVALCYGCLSEHAPEALKELTSEENGYDLDG